MAGDWLKVEKATIDKPEIRLVARLCDVSRDAAFAAWFRLWCWFDTETEDGHFPALTPEDCDDIGRLQGLGRACAEAGWIEFAADGGAIIRNWDRHIAATSLPHPKVCPASFQEFPCATPLRGFARFQQLCQVFLGVDVRQCRLQCALPPRSESLGQGILAPRLFKP